MNDCEHNKEIAPYISLNDCEHNKEITPDISLNHCEHNKEITPDISLLLFGLFACENDFKTKNIVFWALKKLHPKGSRCCKLEGTQVL